MQNLQALREALLTPHAPTEKWPQTTCSSGDIRIDDQGNWYYQNSKIKRVNLCRLFASVLQYQNHQYLLTTPAEQCEVEVSDVPFVIVGWREANIQEGRVIICLDNLQREWPICGDFEVQTRIYQGQEVPYLQLNYGLFARVNRNVYYQWAEVAEQDDHSIYLYSAGKKHFLAR